MSKINIGGCDSGALCNESGDTAPNGAADWLSLAAAPVFAIMALLTATPHGATAGILCSTGNGLLSLNGMTVMYALMSVFHTAPWVKRVSSRRS